MKKKLKQAILLSSATAAAFAVAPEALEAKAMYVEGQEINQTDDVLIMTKTAPINVIKHSFKDVTETHEEAIQFMLTKGLKGINSQEFGTVNGVTRSQAAIFFANTLGLELEKQPAHGFKDVPAYADKHVRALKAAGYMNGKSSTVFGSHEYLTRGQIALIVSRIYGLKGNPNNNNFLDVQEEYREAVAGMYDVEITTGITSVKYGTHEKITRGNLAIFLHRLNDFHSLESPKVEEIVLISDTEIHLLFNSPLTQLNSAFVEVNAIRFNDRNSSISKAIINGRTNMEVKIEGSKLILKAKNNHYFKTGFERDFEINIKENAVSAIGSGDKNSPLKYELIDDELYEDFSQMKVKMRDKAKPVIFQAISDVDDSKVDITFSESVQYTESNRVANLFEIYNTSANGKGIELKKISPTETTITFSKAPINTSIDFNKIRVSFNATTSESIVDFNKNTMDSHVLTGLFKQKRVVVIDLTKLQKELTEKIKTAKQTSTKEKTKESITRLQNAIDNGNKILKADKVTSTQLETAIKSIDNALKGLKNEVVKPIIPENPLATELKNVDTKIKAATTISNYMLDSIEKANLKTIIHQGRVVYQDELSKKEDLTKVLKELNSQVSLIQGQHFLEFEQLIEQELDVLVLLEEDIESDSGNQEKLKEFNTQSNKVKNLQAKYQNFKNSISNY